MVENGEDHNRFEEFGGMKSRFFHLILSKTSRLCSATTMFSYSRSEMYFYLRCFLRDDPLRRTTKKKQMPRGIAGFFCRFKASRCCIEVSHT